MDREKYNENIANWYIESKVYWKTLLDNKDNASLCVKDVSNVIAVTYWLEMVFGTYNGKTYFQIPEKINFFKMIYSTPWSWYKSGH